MVGQAAGVSCRMRVGFGDMAFLVILEEAALLRQSSTGFFMLFKSLGRLESANLWWRLQIRPHFVNKGCNPEHPCAAIINQVRELLSREGWQVQTAIHGFEDRLLAHFSRLVAPKLFF